MQKNNIKQIDVNVKERYGVLVGNNITNIVLQYVQNKQKLIITDSNVYELYSQTMHNFLDNKNNVFYFQAGEESKNYKTLCNIYDFFISRNADRYTYVIAFGGGVVGDISAFAASTYMRGMPLIQLPTTLLAMVDSSVGGKTAINYGGFKNIIGSFYQPNLVVCDVRFLDSLQNREFNSALSEIIKYGVIGDKSLFEFIEAHKKAIKEKKDDILIELVLKSIKNKIKIVEQDEKEKGNRALLNFGHTLAHAIESATNYKTYLHGEAVSIGSAFAANLSYKLGLIDKSIVCRITELLSYFNLPVSLKENIPTPDLLNIMEKDKKNKNGILRFVLTKNIGSSIIAGDLDSSNIKEAIDEIKG